MKNLLKNTLVFTALTFVLSSLISCTNTASTNTTSSKKDSTDSSAPATSSAASKSSEYPSVTASIMQADIKDVDGGTFKLEDKKGKIVLVNLWATWCGPCVAAMPELIALQDKYKDKNFEVVGLVTDDESPESIKKFAQAKNLNYQLGYADVKLMSEFIKITRLPGIPQSILINREGKMVGIFPGGGPRVMAQIQETVEKAVNE